MQTATTANGTDPMVFDTQMAIHRRIAPGAMLLLLAVVLSGCIPNSQSGSRSSAGAPVGTTLHMSLKDDVGALIGGELLGAAESGFDQLVGDLAQTGDGKWRGVVTGSADRSIETSILGTQCKDKLSGTQQIEVVGTRGTYAEGRNLRLALTPVSPPSYKSYPSCNPPSVKPKAPNGIEWLDFYLDAYQDAGMDVKLPDKPGGTWKWELAPNPNPGYPGGCGGLDVLRCERTTTLTVEYR
jgi:hypothetical protein